MCPCVARTAATLLTTAAASSPTAVNSTTVDLRGGLDNPTLPYAGTNTPVNIGTTDPSTHPSSDSDTSSTYYLCFADKSVVGFASEPSAHHFTLYKHVVVHTQHHPPAPPPVAPAADASTAAPAPWRRVRLFQRVPERRRRMHHGSNGICEDGGRGAQYSTCDLGYDCDDCGDRSCVGPPLLPLPSPPPPTPPPPTPPPPTPPPPIPPSPSPPPAPKPPPSPPPLGHWSLVNPYNTADVACADWCIASSAYWTVDDCLKANPTTHFQFGTSSMTVERGNAAPIRPVPPSPR